MEARFEGESKRGMDKDRVYPYKIMCILLYASDNTPGITRTSPGIMSINFTEFRREMSLPSGVKLQMYLHILRDMGLLAWVQTHKSYAIVALSPATGWSETNV